MAVTSASQQQSEDLQAASHRDGDIDASIVIDVVFDTVNDNERQSTHSISLFESDAIREYAINAGLLDDDEFLRYEASICALNSN